MKTKTRQDYLADAEKGLAFIDVRVQKNLFSHLEGVDTLDLGLDVLAKALAELFSYPRVPGDDTPRIDDVLAYLVARGDTDKETVQQARAVLEGIKGSTYLDGLRDDQVQKLEDARRALHDSLEGLIVAASEAAGAPSDA